jgi:hypothetical protein
MQDRTCTMYLHIPIINAWKVEDPVGATIIHPSKTHSEPQPRARASIHLASSAWNHFQRSSPARRTLRIAVSNTHGMKDGIKNATGREGRESYS